MISDVFPSPPLANLVTLTAHVWGSVLWSRMFDSCSIDGPETYPYRQFRLHADLFSHHGCPLESTYLVPGTCFFSVAVDEEVDMMYCKTTLRLLSSRVG